MLDHDPYAAKLPLPVMLPGTLPNYWMHIKNPRRKGGVSSLLPQETCTPRIIEYWRKEVMQLIMR